MMKVFLRKNPFDNNGQDFLFRSECMTTLPQAQLVKEIAQYNTTITEPDTLGVLNVFKNVVIEYTQKGYIVETPVGLFYETASGTTDDKMADFEPKNKNNNHEFRLIYRPSMEIKKDINNNTRFERTTNELKSHVFIDAVMEAASNEANAVRAGDSIKVLGRYLQYDKTDGDQGVFLKNLSTGETFHLTYCTQNTPRLLEVRVDSSVPAGTYELSVSSRPATVLDSRTYLEPIEVSA